MLVNGYSSDAEFINTSKEYDGTNWTAGGNTNETTRSRAGGGTAAAALVTGGRPAPSSFINETEVYDGSSWSAGDDMISNWQAGGYAKNATTTNQTIFGSPKNSI